VKGVLRTAAPRNGPIRWNQEIDTGSNNAIELDEQKIKDDAAATDTLAKLQAAFLQRKSIVPRNRPRPDVNTDRFHSRDFKNCVRRHRGWRAAKS